MMFVCQNAGKKGVRNLFMGSLSFCQVKRKSSWKIEYVSRVVDDFRTKIVQNKGLFSVPELYPTS